MNKQLARMIFFGLFLIAGCASSGPRLASSIEDITGVFERTSGHGNARFDADGTFRLGPSSMLVTIEPPISPPGEYWFEGDQLHLMPADDDPICDGIAAVYEVRLAESGNLSFMAVDDACDVRLANMQGVIDLETSEPSAEWAPVE